MELKNQINEMKNPGISDYISLFKKIRREADSLQGDTTKDIKIAVLASFTFRGIEEALTVECFRLGIAARFYFSDYGQYIQDILDTRSGLYAFDPNLVIVCIDTQTMLGENWLVPNSIPDRKRRTFCRKTVKNIISLISTLKTNTKAKILLHNFQVPSGSCWGILENKQEFGIQEAIELINKELRDCFKSDSQVFVFDYNLFCSKTGFSKVIDPRLYYAGDIKINLQILPGLAKEYLSYIKPMMSLNRKCIVLDLDNTLWGGIIGEDGMEGIQLGPTPEGRPYSEFQRYLLSLNLRGIILAINSRNNPDDALAVINNHPYMTLREENFAAFRINWEDKISNLVSLSKELNIGLDSMVYIDDDKINRDLVSQSLPEVLVVDLPADPTLYLSALMELNDFNSLQVTEEDLQKRQMYSEQRKRTEFLNISRNITEYLKGLEMKVFIDTPNHFSIPRISQLTLKTNQFNMTTRRYSEEDIKNFTEKPNFLLFSVSVTDRFGDNGTTGVVIIEKMGKVWRIDTLLLSCRILGRDIENALLGYILSEAKKGNADTLIGEFIPTKKNLPAKNFYQNNGFSLSEVKNQTEIWKFEVKNEYKPIEYIKLQAR